MKNRIEIIKGDITELKVDAIVNAANQTLLGGGGVDGAIHRKAGHLLLQECEKLGGCQTGKAKLTKGYNLPAKFIIHTVGPIYIDGKHNEPELLASCYKESLRIAFENKFSAIAFPAISTGVYRYPKIEAAKIAFETVIKFLSNHEIPEKVIFCCFDNENYQIYNRINLL